MKIFVPLPLVVHLELRISPRIFEKIITAKVGYSWAWGKLICGKKPEVENSWHYPFKPNGQKFSKECKQKSSQNLFPGKYLEEITTNFNIAERLKPVLKYLSLLTL